MATTVTLPPTRAEIFKHGLTNARGKITFLGDGWGTVTLEGSVSAIKYHFRLDVFPPEQRASVMIGLPVRFDAKPGQRDMHTLSLPAGSRRDKPNISAIRLENFVR